MPEAAWDDAKSALVATGDAEALAQWVAPAPQGQLQALQPHIDAHFDGATLRDIFATLQLDDSDFARDALKAITRNAPLAMECALQVIRRLRSADSIRQALDMEFRYTYRAVAQGDFIEGIRAAIIDRDRNPKWAHAGPDKVPPVEIANMLTPLKEKALNWTTHKETTP